MGKLIDQTVLRNCLKILGRGGGQVVSVLAFYSDDPSSNPAEVYSLSVILCLKERK